MVRVFRFGKRFGAVTRRCIPRSVVRHRAVRHPAVSHSVGRRPAGPDSRQLDRGRARACSTALALTVTLVVAGCSSAGAVADNSSYPGSGQPSTPVTVGTRTHLSTVTSAVTEVVTEPPTTVVTTPTEPTLVPPPATTPEPKPKHGDCPYLTDREVEDANGQHTGTTSVIDVDPYPICVFTRSDGRYLASTRIIEADTPAQAVAAVNQHVPVADSFPVTHPQGWSGGAMATPDGVPGYPDAGSIYAVAKGTTAVIAISNQKQSIKGRQMVRDIVENLGL